MAYSNGVNRYKVPELPERPIETSAEIFRKQSFHAKPHKELSRNFRPDFPIDLLITDNRIIMNYAGVPAHFHDYMEVLYILGGSASIGIQDEVIHAGADDMILVKSDEIHWLKFKDDVHCSILTLLFMPSVISSYEESGEEFSYMNCFLENSKQHTRYVSSITGTSEKIPKLLMEMYNEYIYRNRGYQTIVKGLLLRFVGELYRSRVIDDPARPYERCQEDFDRLLPAIRFIEQNSHTPLTLQQVADVAHMSYYHFSHIFSSVIGQSFKNYLNYVRIKKAEDLFIPGTKSISEAAYACGFSDLSSFNRAYKRIRNCTPRQVIKAKRIGSV